VNRWYYLKVLKCLRENVRRKSPQLWRNNSWFLHHDNVPVHASLLIHDFLANKNATVFPQPLDLAPADRTTISDDSRDCGKSANSHAQSQKWCTSTVSRSGNGVGSGASMQEGSTLKAIRVIQLQTCPKKL
jgi:hypothetical protein